MIAAGDTPPLTPPRIHVYRMVVFLALVGFLGFILYRQVLEAFWANPGLNGLIFGLTLIGVLLAIRQVGRLFPEVRWVNELRRAEEGVVPPKAPVILAPVSALIHNRASRQALSVTTTRTLLDSIAARLDEGRDILRYLAGTLILLGLLGTFWGLIDTLSSVGQVIQSLRGGGGDAAALFDDLKRNLARPLAGIGLAFAASLFGLAGSLVLGFLDLQVGQAQNRFYTEFENWLALSTTDTAQPSLPGADLSGRTALMQGELAAALNRLTTAVTDGSGNRAATQAMANLAEGIQGLVQHMRAEQQMIRDWVEAQAARERELKQVLDRLARERVS